MSLATSAAIDLEHEVHQELIEENDNRGLEYTSAGLLLEDERPGDRTNAWVAGNGDNGEQENDDDDEENDCSGGDGETDVFVAVDRSDGEFKIVTGKIIIKV